MEQIYFIGGSPCSGKSTVAEQLAKEHNLHYFKVDDYLEDYTKKGALEQKSICSKVSTMTTEETWMRDPMLQAIEELEFYREIFDFILEDLKKIQTSQGIITEGAAYLPELMSQLEISPKHYVCITPTKDFQVTNYKKRPWIPLALEGCSDQTLAFQNWMERDAIFGDMVRKQCEASTYSSFITDGNITIENMIQNVSSIFFP